MNKDDLKPCPFCGGKNIDVDVEHFSHGCVGHWFVRCMDCTATVGNPALIDKPDTKYQAVKMWNVRKYKA